MTFEGGGRLVGNDELRLESKGCSDQYALPHSPRQLVRKSTHDAFGIADLDLIEQFERAQPRLTPRQIAPQAQAIRKLAFDPTPGIECGEWVLRYQCDLVAENLIEFPFGQVPQVATIEDDTPGRYANGARQDAEQGLGDSRFSGSAFSNQSHGLAGRDADAYPAQNQSVIKLGPCAQIANAQYRVRHRRSTGSSARRSPSPSWLKHSTVAKSAASGAARTHQV